jgi:hypothetical protein
LRANRANLAQAIANRALDELQRYHGYHHTEVAYVLSLRAEAMHALGQENAADDDRLRAQKIYSDLDGGTTYSAMNFGSTRINAIPHYRSNQVFASGLSTSADEALRQSLAWQAHILSQSADQLAAIRAADEQEMRALEKRQRDAEAHTRWMRGGGGARYISFGH